jgi:hypothetical protein
MRLKMTNETVQQRNMRMGWGCKCHGETFCPDEIFIGMEDDQPIFAKRDSVEGMSALSASPQPAKPMTGEDRNAVTDVMVERAAREIDPSAYIPSSLQDKNDKLVQRQMRATRLARKALQAALKNGERP